MSKTENLKKQLKKVTYLFILISLSFNSCKKEVFFPESADLAEAEAIRDWVKGHISQAPTNPFRSLSPVWSSATVRADGDLIIHELILENPNNIFIGGNTTDASSQTPYFKRNTIKLVIFSDGSGKILAGCYMAAVGSTDLENSSIIHYRKPGKFNGKVHYFNLSGSYSNGAVYIQGAVTATIRTMTGFSDNLQVGGAGKLMTTGPEKVMTIPAGECNGEYIPVTAMACAGAGGYTNCTPYIRWEYREVECQAHDGGGEGGGGDYDGSHGGGGSGNPGNGTVNKKKPEFYQLVTDPAISLQSRFNCFDNIPDAGATYSVTLSADLIVNDDAFELVDDSWECGHAFITMTKTNGNQSSTQSFGFYPEPPILSLSTGPVGSKLNDNGDHDYDSAMTMSGISAADFKMLQIVALNKAHSSYDINDYNCTNYAMDVFNSIRDAQYQITIDDWVYGGVNFGKTPNGLYLKMIDLKNNGYTNIITGAATAPTKSGGCN